MRQIKSFVIAMFFGGMMLSGCKETVSEIKLDIEEATSNKENKLLIEEITENQIKYINGIIHIPNADIIDTLNYMVDKEMKLDYLNKIFPSFKSTEYYFSKALNDLYENDNTVDYINYLKGQYPNCIKIEMLADSSANVEYTHQAHDLAWLLNKNNQIVIDSALYTFYPYAQTIEYLQKLDEKPIFNIDDAQITWVSDNKVSIVFNQLKSLIKAPNMLVRGHRWDGKHRLQAALHVHNVYALPVRSKYDNQLNEWYMSQVKQLRVVFKQDRKMWYGWTKKPTNFSYELKMLYVSNYGGTWTDVFPQNWTGSWYGREDYLVIFDKRRRVYHGDRDGYKNLPTEKKDLHLTVSVDVKSGQVPEKFNLFYSNIEYK
ncbi:MAG: hypothetical protein MI866_03700 [Bacteroidales bacterium]|nr:hypothetical protein [Bacteroidales bacterium]